MGRLLPACCAGLLAVAANAQQAPLPASRSGYAFEYPRILAQQQLFGIAHGVELLAQACRAVPASAATAEGAYALWRVREEPAIAAAQADLGRYYFNDESVTTHALVGKLALKEALDLAPDSDELRAACSTLPEALQQPRYALAQRFRLAEMMERAIAAIEIEVRDRHCRPLFPPQLLSLHEARYGVWRELNLPLLDESNKTLAKDWPADGPAASFDAWYADLRRKTRAAGDLAACVAFSESLKRPETSLREVFRMPPPLQQAPHPQ